MSSKADVTPTTMMTIMFGGEEDCYCCVCYVGGDTVFYYDTSDYLFFRAFV